MAINTIKATIQMRRGAEANFDPDQMTAGEWGVSTDSKKVWMCFAPGIVRRMSTYEAFEEDMRIIQQMLATCQDIQVAVEAFERLARQHSTAAASSAQAADSSAQAASVSAADAQAAEGAAEGYRDEAGASATAAAGSARAAKASQDAAKASEINSAGSATASAASASDAEDSKDASALSETKSKASELASKASEEAAKDWSDRSKSYAVGTEDVYRPGDSVDNAKAYYEKSKLLVQGYEGIMPMGTISFADLDNPDNQVPKYMFNISDGFTSDDRFKDGGGKEYGPGMNVFYTMDEMWDVMAGASVIGIKGENEDTYRQGNVNITKENLGIGIASDTKAGLIKVDGVVTSVNEDGVLQVDIPEATIDYNQLENRPSITDVVLEGNKTLGDLGGAEVKEMTVAEFEALPEGKDEEDVIYFIKDAVPVESPLITEERIAGIESDLTELGTEVAGNTQAISALNGTVTSLSGTVAQHETDITALGTTTAQHGTDISALNGTVTQHSVDIDALESGKADTNGIVLTGDVTGASVFNAQTGKTEISAQRRGCYINRSDLTYDVGSWYKIASIETVKGFANFSIDLLVSYTVFGSTISGILRTNIYETIDGIIESSSQINWVYNTGITPTDAILLIKHTDTSEIAEIWYKNAGQYQVVTFDVLTEAIYVRATNVWGLYTYNGQAGLSVLPSDCVQIPATLATIQNPINGALNVKTFPTGGGTTMSFSFSTKYTGQDSKSCVPVLIVVGSQADNQTIMFPATLYSSGGIGRPADKPSLLSDITAENGLVTISLISGSKWSEFMVLYDSSLATIT